MSKKKICKNQYDTETAQVEMIAGKFAEFREEKKEKPIELDYKEIKSKLKQTSKEEMLETIIRKLDILFDRLEIK